MTTILGIDPGLAKTGYGIIRKERDSLLYVTHGFFETKAGRPPGERLEAVYDMVRELIRLHKPDEAGVESLYFAKNITSALPVAQAKGVVLLALAQEHIPTFEYAPQEIKLAIVGAGRAEKHQVQELVKVLLGLKEVPSPDHASDALAAAICHAHSPAAFRKGKGNHV